MRVVWAAVLGGVLVGCASYEPPRSGETATIVFAGAARYAYIDTSSPAGKSCTSVPQATGDNWKNQVIPAGRQVWILQGIDTRGLAFGMSCGFTYSFTPEEGAKYVSEYSLAGGRCSLHLSQQLSSGALVPVSTLKHEPKSCW